MNVVDKPDSSEMATNFQDYKQMVRTHFEASAGVLVRIDSSSRPLESVVAIRD